MVERVFGGNGVRICINLRVVAWNDGVIIGVVEMTSVNFIIVVLNSEIIPFLKLKI